MQYTCNVVKRREKCSNGSFIQLYWLPRRKVDSMQLQICSPHGRPLRLYLRLFSRCASVRKARVGPCPHTDYSWNDRLRLLFFFPVPLYPPTHRYQRAHSYPSYIHMHARYNRCTFQKVTPLIGNALNIRNRETGRQKVQCLNCHLPPRDCMAYQA